MANDYVMTNDTTNNRWNLSYVVDASGTKNKTLKTAGTFVDRDILISVTTPPTSRTAGAGDISLSKTSGSVTLTAGSGDSGSSTNQSISLATSTPSSGVYYTLTATGSGVISGTGRGNVSTGSGWVTSGNTWSNTATDSLSYSDTTQGYITKSVHGSAVSGSIPTIPNGAVGIEIQPKGYIIIPAGYNPQDRYVYANVADVSGESRAASGFSLSVSSVSGNSDVSVGTLSDNKYPIIANNLGIAGTLTASTPGWFSTGSATDSDTDNVTVGKMAAAVITASATGATATTTVAPGTVSISANTTAVTNKTRLALTPTTATSGINQYYIAIQASAAANTTGTTSSITGTANASVTTAGYAPTTLTGTGSVTGTATAKTSKKDSSVYYIPVTSCVGSLTGTSSNGSATVVLDNINDIEEISDISNKTAGVDYWKIKATATTTAGSYTPSYTVTTPGWVNGTISGTAQTVNVNADTTGQTIYIPRATYSGSNGNISIATAGYLPAGTVVASMDTAEGNVSFAYGITATTSGTKKPVISKQSTPSGVTNAASGNATTTAPSSGVYVAIKTTENTATLTAKENITTAGFVPTGEFNNNTILVGATASDMTYVPITTASPSFTGGAISGSVTDITGSNVTLSDTNNGISVTGAASAGRAAVTYNGAVNGWVSKTSGTTAYSGTSSNTTLTGKTRYITAITVPKDKTFSVTTVADTALDTTSDLAITNAAYRRVTVANSGTTVVTSASKTAGNLTVAAYDTASSSSTTSQSIVENGVWVSSTAGASGTYYGKVTVDSGDYSATVNSHTITKPTITPSIGGNITDITQTNTPSGTNGTDYWTIDPGGSVTTNGSSKTVAKATIDTAGYVAAGYKTSSESSITLNSSQITIAAGTNRYLLKASITPTSGTASATANAGTASITTQPSASASATATPTGMNGGYYTDSTTSSYYIDVSASASSNSGVVTATGGSASASVTASSVVVGIGYNPTSQTVSTTASSTGNKTGNTVTTTAATASDSANQRIYFKASTITTSSTNDGMSTYFNSGTSSDKNVTITPKYTATAGYRPAVSTATNNGGTTYWKIKTTSVTQGTTTVSGTTATRGTASWGTGWISSGSIAAATFANSATSGQTYVDISNTTAAPILVSNDYLYINKGYTDNLKISLAKLVPNGASADLADAHMLNGYSAYNNDGVLITGNIPTNSATDITFNGRTVTVQPGYYAAEISKDMAAATVTSGAGSATISDPTYNSTSGKFDLTASGSVAAPTVNTAGYISSSVGTRNGNSISGSKTLNKINLASEKTSGNLTVAPTLARTAKPSGDTWTDAANGSATTTKPTSGPYVQIDAAANTNSVVIKGKVTAAGYGTTSYYTAADTAYTVGAAKATTRYIPIKTGTATTGSASVTKITTDGSNAGTNISAVVGTATTTEPSSGYYIAFTGSGSSAVTTAGWFDVGTLTTTTSSTTYFPVTTATCTVAGGVLSTSGFTKSDLALTLGSGSSTNMANITVGAQDTSNYPYYFKVNGSTPAVSGTTSASVTAITDAHTAGYLPAKAASNFRNAQSATPAVSVNATSASTYVSLKKAAVSIGGTNSVTGSLTGNNATLTNTNNSGIEIVGGGSATITATATTSTAGYAPASTQIGSATKTGSGTKTQYLKEVELVAPSSGTREFGIKVPNGDSTITFVFHVDSSGNVTVDDTYTGTYS